MATRKQSDNVAASLATAYPEVIYFGEGTLALLPDDEELAGDAFLLLQRLLVEGFGRHSVGADHGYTVTLNRTALVHGSIHIKFDLKIERTVASAARAKKAKPDWGKLGYYAGLAQLVVAAGTLIYQVSTDAEKKINEKYPGAGADISIKAEPPAELFEDSKIKLRSKVLGEKKPKSASEENAEAKSQLDNIMKKSKTTKPGGMGQ